MALRSLMLGIRRKVSLYNFSSVFNPIYDLFIGGSQRPVFFDIEKTFPTLSKLDDIYPEIRNEFEELLPRQQNMPRYHDLDTDLVYSSGRINRDRRWNVFMLYCYGAKPEHNRLDESKPPFHVSRSQ